MKLVVVLQTCIQVKWEDQKFKVIRGHRDLEENLGEWGKRRRLGGSAGKVLVA